MGDFDSVKIGVCDAYWTPGSSGSESFLGLTKGGCELTYTPEWYDLQTDRYGKSPTDSALVGETVSVKIPLAETDMDKIEMFAHTAQRVSGSDGATKLTFGRFPGFRLGAKAGRIRLHPVAMGTDRSEDVIIYKSVNKSPLNLNYKLDEERIFQCEFIGMIKRDHMSGAMLWEIGDSTMDPDFSDITLSQTLIGGTDIPTNLQAMVIGSGGNMWIAPANADAQTSSDSDLATVQFKAYVEFGGRAYNITSQATFELSDNTGVEVNGVRVIKEAPTGAPVFSTVGMAADEWADIDVGGTDGKLKLKIWDSAISVLEPYMLKDEGLDTATPANWRAMTYGDIAEVTLTASWGTLVARAVVNAEITA